MQMNRNVACSVSKEVNVHLVLNAFEVDYITFAHESKQVDKHKKIQNVDSESTSLGGISYIERQNKSSN